MAPLASAQLSAAITPNQLSFAIQSGVTPTGAVGFPPVGTFPQVQLPLQIDSEIMYVVNQPSSGLLVVRSRGAEGTIASSHDFLTPVYIGASTDFGPNPPAISGFIDITNAYPINIGSLTYTVALPSSDTIYNINAVAAAAITLPTPLGSQNGLVIKFTANTGSAHVITCTSGIQSGVSTQPKSTITFGGIIGAGCELVAENGFWNVPVTANGVTIA
jgi:hypothetical protein